MVNLINFHKDPRNDLFVKEQQIDVYGHGLDGYDIRLKGNGNNTYIIKVIDSNNDKSEIRIHENHIIDWIIKIKSEHKELRDSLRIEGFGLLEKEKDKNITYGWVYDTECHTFDHIKFGDCEYKVYDIIINNDTDDAIYNYTTNSNCINWSKMFDAVADYRQLVDPESK